MRDSLWPDAALLGVAQATCSGCRSGMPIAVARLDRPEMVGRFAPALAIAAPVMPFSNLALRQIL